MRRGCHAPAKSWYVQVERKRIDVRLCLGSADFAVAGSTEKFTSRDNFNAFDLFDGGPTLPRFIITKEIRMYICSGLQ